MKPKMTVGLAFSADHNTVLMQLKNRPEDCAGFLNGPGGKQNVGESIVNCMVREFEEETGLKSTKDDWLYFHHERYVSGTDLYFYTTDHLNIFLAQEKTDEGLVLASTDEVYRLVDLIPTDARHMVKRNAIRKIGLPDTCKGIMYNMAYLIPMALTYIRFPEHRYLEG